MLGTGGPFVQRPGLLRTRVPAAARTALVACVLMTGGALLAGCAQAASATTEIRLGTASIPQPAAAGGMADAFLVIQNNGPADRLISARTSDGGRVTFRGPVSAGSAIMRTLPGIGIPAGATVRLVPNGPHLLIIGARPLRGDTEVTLTLVFARAGPVSVQAEITNPETGGSSYF
jgi:copper(I)-binding protein